MCVFTVGAVAVNNAPVWGQLCSIYNPGTGAAQQ